MASHTHSSQLFPKVNNSKADSSFRVVDICVGRTLRAVEGQKEADPSSIPERIGVVRKHVQRYEEAAEADSASKFHQAIRSLELELHALFAELPRPLQRRLTKSASGLASAPSASNDERLVEALKQLSPGLRARAIEFIELISSDIRTARRPASPTNAEADLDVRTQPTSRLP
jgi:hypothetical protein